MQCQSLSIYCLDLLTEQPAMVILYNPLHLISFKSIRCYSRSQNGRRVVLLENVKCEGSAGCYNGRRFDMNFDSVRSETTNKLDDLNHCKLGLRRDEDW